MSFRREVGFSVLHALLVCLLASASAGAAEYSVTAEDSLIGSIGTVESVAEETLLDIGRRYSLGYNDMAIANPNVDIWLPGEGTDVVLPLQFVLPNAPRRGVVLNLAEYRLYFYSATDASGMQALETYPISIGRMDWETPLGVTRIVAKSRNPSWYPPQSVREEHAAEGDVLPAVVPPGPDNPLGAFALRLGIPGYLIHGTNKPAGVGMRVTHGCLRMFPEDIEALFERLPSGTTVRIINQPVKAGWSGDTLYLEVHPMLAESGQELDTEEAVKELVVAEQAPMPLTELTRALVAATDEREAEIDWDLAMEVFAEAHGLPVAVGLRVSSSAAGDE